jgi:carboxymethylenebutenolidase
MASRTHSFGVALAVFAAAALLGACGQSSSPPAPAASAPSVAATAAQHAHDAPAASPVAEAPPKIPVLEQQIAYGEGKKHNFVGFLAMPGDAAEPLPGIIVIHEWWGLNDNIKAVTRRLAAEGYVALAVDLYGGATAQTPDEAQKLMTALVAEPEETRTNLGKAYEYLDKYALAPRIASVGWCLGGGWSLQTAFMLPDDLDAMVMYYGQIDGTRAQLETLKMPLLGFFGALDQSIPLRQVQDFRALLTSMGKDAEILIYSDANHAFANPSGGNYNEKAATDSWEKTLAFLDRTLKQKK